MCERSTHTARTHCTHTAHVRLCRCSVPFCSVSHVRTAQMGQRYAQHTQHTSVAQWNTVEKHSCTAYFSTAAHTHSVLCCLCPVLCCVVCVLCCVCPVLCCVVCVLCCVCPVLCCVLHNNIQHSDSQHTAHGIRRTAQQQTAHSKQHTARSTTHIT